MTPKQVDIPFPIAGIDQSVRRSSQPVLTTPNCSNVRGFAPIADRHSGGKRCGTRRLITQQLFTPPEDAVPARVTCLSILPDSAFTEPEDPPDDPEYDPDVGNPHDPPDDEDDLPVGPGEPNDPDGSDGLSENVENLDSWDQLDDDMTGASPLGPAAVGDPPASVFNGAGQPQLVLAVQVGHSVVINVASDTFTDCDPDHFTEWFPQVTPYGKAPAVSGVRTETGPFWYGVDGVNNLRIDPLAVIGVCPSDDWDILTASYRTDQGLSAAPMPLGCRLICAYRGRIVVARQDGDNTGLADADKNASMWYMSRVLNPYDWGYGEDPIETCAVAGTDPTIGQPGDSIVALIPAGDDYLIFGCATSLYMLEGDPGYGGQIQRLSRDTGVLGARAWCFDEGGTLYFMGTGGLYRFRGPGSPVENISGQRMFRNLSRINLAETLVQLVYDAMTGCVHIFMTNISPDIAGSHAVYDTRADAFWFDRYTGGIIEDGSDELPGIREDGGGGLYETTLEPWSVCSFTGPDEQDRRFLFGGNDGFIRRPLDSALGDDEVRYKGPDSSTGQGSGVDIVSFFRSAPIVPFGHGAESMALEIQADGADNNAPLSLPTDTVDWYWLVAESESEIANKFYYDARTTGEWFADNGYGFQEPAGLRQAGAVHQVMVRQVSHTATWGMERITAWFKPGGRRRRRGD